MHRRERRFAQRDTNRLVRPYEWGREFVERVSITTDDRLFFRRHTHAVMQKSDEFYDLPPVNDYYENHRTLTWTSAVETPTPNNNIARAYYFPAPFKKGQRRKAVLILPHWNAPAESYFDLARLFNRLGYSALRLTLPYHEERNAPECERSDYLVCSNVGRTIQSVRQAALDTRAAVHWLKQHKRYDRLGLVGTSIGSCTGFLAFAHEPRLDVAVFNHVSGFFADVVWHGISTRHVRDGFGDDVTLDELREYWRPISPLPFIPRVRKQLPRPTSFLAARYDLTFPADLSREVIAEARRHELNLDVSWLPYGHYTSGEKPYVYYTALKIASFLWRHL
jgi:dienelactone hydrolase